MFDIEFYQAEMNHFVTKLRIQTVKHMIILMLPRGLMQIMVSSDRFDNWSFIKKERFFTV